MNTAIVGVVPQIPVNGQVLKWARTERGLSLQAAAELLDITVPELKDYEEERRAPLIGLLTRMSERYRINYAALLMDEPLPSERRPTDFRKDHGELPSVETLSAIQDVRDALETFAELSESVTHGRVVRKPDLPHAAIDDDADHLAARERSRFGVTVQQQHDWPNDAYARRAWRERIEHIRVFTYMIALDDECSGFSVLQDGWAAICVNDAVANEGRKIFTLFHEYAHLLLRQAGISDENTSNRVEKFCNRFAGSFLIPERALKTAVGPGVREPTEFGGDEVAKLARRFRVSGRAMAYRLEDLGLAPKGFYGRVTGPWELPSSGRDKTAKPKGQPNYKTLQLKKLGRLHVSTVAAAVKRRMLNAHDAYALTQLNEAALLAAAGKK